MLRTTYDQNLVLPGIPGTARQVVGYALAPYGLTCELDSVLRQMVACMGKQFCNLAITETKGYAYQLIEALRRRNVQLYGINLRLSGQRSAAILPAVCGAAPTVRARSQHHGYGREQRRGPRCSQARAARSGSTAWCCHSATDRRYKPGRRTRGRMRRHQTTGTAGKTAHPNGHASPLTLRLYSMRASKGSGCMA
jgi:hypothetical protein